LVSGFSVRVAAINGSIYVLSGYLLAAVIDSLGRGW
jgi:hypothetical protein